MPNNLCVTALSDRWLNITASSVVQYYPLNRYPLYRDLGFGEVVVPSTDKFFDNMASFPFAHLLRDEEVDVVVAATKQTVRIRENPKRINPSGLVVPFLESE